jgi:3-dehydroquinate dehydratase
MNREAVKNCICRKNKGNIFSISFYQSSDKQTLIDNFKEAYSRVKHLLNTLQNEFAIRNYTIKNTFLGELNYLTGS